MFVKKNSSTMADVSTGPSGAEEEVKKPKEVVKIRCVVENQEDDGPSEPLEEFDCRELSILTKLQEDDRFRLIEIDNVSFYVMRESVGNEQHTEWSSRCLTDLVPRVYEGGFRIWESTYDILSYIITNKLSFKNKKVLDLGCGFGLAGICAVKYCANIVHFQDYNDDVLKEVTIPNVVCNTTGVETMFFSGDWDCFATYRGRPGLTYDCILSAETIYTPKYYEKLFNVLKNRLKGTGEAYFATKTYYFGVGGGSMEFKNFLETKDMFNVSTVWKTSEGVQREILLVKFREDKRPRQYSLIFGNI